MKTSKFFLSTLIAASAMTASAYAAELTGTADGTGTVSYGGESLSLSDNIYSIELTDNGNTVKTLYIADGYTVKLTKEAWNVFDIGTDSNLTGSGVLNIHRVNSGGWVSVTKLTADTLFAGTLKLSTANSTANHVMNLSASANAMTLELANANLAVRVTDSVSLGGLSGVAGTKVVSTTAIPDTTNNSGNGGYFSADNDTTQRTLTLAGSGSYSFAGQIGSATNQSSLNLSKSGTGTQTLSGTNYIGDLSVSGGTLALVGSTTIVGSVTNSANLTLGGSVSFNSAINNTGTITFSDSVTAVSFNGLTPTSSNFDATISGLQENVTETYTLCSGTGTISGLTTENVTINSHSVSAINGNVATDNFSVYNILEGDQVSYSAADVSGADRINVLGTLDVGKISQSNYDLMSVQGAGVVKFEGNDFDGSHAAGVKLSSGFTGTLHVSKNANLPLNSTLGGTTKVVLDGAYLWTNRTATFTQEFEVRGKTENYGNTGANKQRGLDSNITYEGTFTLTEDSSFAFEQGSTTFTGEVKGESGSELISGATVTFNGKATLDTLSIKGGTTTFNGETTIDTLDITGGSATITGAIIGTSFEKKGSGTLTIGKDSSSDTKAGRMNDGTLSIAGGEVILKGRNSGTGAWGGAIVVGPGATLKLGTNDVLGYGNNAGARNGNETDSITANGSADKIAKIELTATQTLSTNVNLNGYTLMTGSAFNSFGGKITATGTNNTIESEFRVRTNIEVDVTNSADVLTMNTVVKNNEDFRSGATITKTGAGKLVIGSNGNDIGGAITLVGGTLETTTAVKTSGVLKLNTTTASLVLGGELSVNQMTVGNTKPDVISIDFGTNGKIVSTKASGGINFGTNTRGEENDKVSFTVALSDEARTALFKDGTYSRDLLVVEGASGDGFWNFSDLKGDDSYNTLEVILSGVLSDYKWESVGLVTDKDSIGSGQYGVWYQTGVTYGDTTADLATLVINVPEPSAFGLLAGVGALALVVSRRKRRV